MSRYDFVPIQHHDGRALHTYCYRENWFSGDQLKAIEAYGDRLLLKRATVGAEKVKAAPTALRKTEVGWITYNEETRGFYDALAEAAQRINAQFYSFDLTGFVEDLQFGVYEGKKRAHYDWHIDAGPNSYAARKLSISVLLSNPQDYQGGDLQFLTGANPMTAGQKARGTIIAFPSYVMHRVTPVTKGVRKSIVAWIAGPPFR